MFHFFVLFIMCLLYIIQGIIRLDIVQVIFVLITILAFQQAFSKLNKKNQLFTGFLFFTGIFIHLLYGNRGLNLFDGVTQNLPLLAIILLAPLLSLPLKGEGILTTVTQKLNEYEDDKRKIFYGVSSFMLMLAPIINMGALRIVHGFVEELKIDNKLLSNAYYGGFTPAIVWSPFFASVGIVLSMADMPYISYMPVGLIFAVIQFLIGLFILRPPKKVRMLAKKMIKNREGNKDYILLLSFVLFLISLLIVLEAITKLQILLLVSINCMVIPAIWVLVRKKWNWTKGQMIEFKNQTIMNTNMEVALFLSAGLFGNALMNTPLTTVLKSVITWSAQGSVIVVFLFVVGFVTFMAFLGIHQIIAVPFVFPLLLATEVGITLHTAAFMCIFSWMLSSSISPLNALNIIISQCVRVNGMKVAFDWNGKFFLVSFITAGVYVILLNQF